MIFENEITKKYGMEIDYEKNSGLWYCQGKIKDKPYMISGISGPDCIIRFLDLFIDISKETTIKRKCSLCNSFKYQFCTNKERIKELREKYGIIPPLKVDPDYCCDKFEGE